MLVRPRNVMMRPPYMVMKAGHDMTMMVVHKMMHHMVMMNHTMPVRDAPRPMPMVHVVMIVVHVMHNHMMHMPHNAVHMMVVVVAARG